MKTSTRKSPKSVAVFAKFQLATRGRFNTKASLMAVSTMVAGSA